MTVKSGEDVGWAMPTEFIDCRGEVVSPFIRGYKWRMQKIKRKRSAYNN